MGTQESTKTDYRCLVGKEASKRINLYHQSMKKKGGAVLTTVVEFSLQQSEDSLSFVSLIEVSRRNHKAHIHITAVRPKPAQRGTDNEDATHREHIL